MALELEMLVELFGWQIASVERDLGLIHDRRGPLRAAALWQLQSRWSPPPVPIGLLLLEDGRTGAYWGIEVARVLGPRQIERFQPPLRWRPPRDASGRPLSDPTSLESFVADLGRFRVAPPVNAP